MLTEDSELPLKANPMYQKLQQPSLEIILNEKRSNLAGLVTNDISYKLVKSIIVHLHSETYVEQSIIRLEGGSEVLETLYHPWLYKTYIISQLL